MTNPFDGLRTIPFKNITPRFDDLVAAGYVPQRFNESYPECSGIIKPRTEYLRILTARQVRLSRFRQHRKRDWRYRMCASRRWDRWVERQKGPRS